MFKKWVFQLHWLLGISAGLVLVVVGVTGSVLSFEREILLIINPHIMRIAAPAQTELNLQKLFDQIKQAEPKKRIASLTFQSDPSLAARVGFACAPNSTKKLDGYYVNPYNGVMLGKAYGEEFFLFVMKLHRWLTLDKVGKQIVGISTWTLIFFCISGLYLRWPRKISDWRTWLCLSFKRSGRSFLWDLHSVIGTWCLVFYLLAACTGLYWSYDWYRGMLFNLAGVARPAAPNQQSKVIAIPPQFDLNKVWAGFLGVTSPYQNVTLRLPETKARSIEISYLPKDAVHNRATNKLAFDPNTGAVIKQDNYRDRSAGQRFMNSIYALHTGSYFGMAGLVLMMLASLMMPLFAITGWLLYLDRRAKKRALKRTLKQATIQTLNDITLQTASFPEILIGFASQTGVAERLAWHTAHLLKATGMVVKVEPLSAITMSHLSQVQRALFVVSTFGDGAPPDSARHFSKLLNQVHSLSLSNLRFGLLALGDKQYRTFCQFGRQLEQWFHAHGATSLFSRIDMHQQDPAAFDVWQQKLKLLAPVKATPLEEQPFSDWTLQARDCLNPDGQGLPTFHLELQPLQVAHWQAGDLLEVMLPDQQTIRQYSIASLPSERALFLLVRQLQPNTASGYLTTQLRLGSTIRARIKLNPNFHLSHAISGLILIGNGTGLASLRGHLKARIEREQLRNWLIFGERNQTHDNYYEEELTAWKKQGGITQLDLVYSRDGAAENQRYVQHRLRFYGEQVREWMRDGATILVSGSLEGMAEEVDNVLCEILGTEQVEQLIEQRRYLRDIY